MTSQLADRSHPVVEFAHALTARLEKLERHHRVPHEGVGNAGATTAHDDHPTR